MKRDQSVMQAHGVSYYDVTIFRKTNLVESNRCSLIPLWLLELYLIFSILSCLKFLSTKTNTWTIWYFDCCKNLFNFRKWIICPNPFLLVTSFNWEILMINIICANNVDIILKWNHVMKGNFNWEVSNCKEKNIK